MQLNVINSRFIELIAGPDREAWALAGDQLYVDLDLSVDALPAGSRLAIGDQAVIEVTDQPHTGCAKFAARFGRDAHKVVWTDEGKRLRLRGLNARVVVGGTVRQGDAVRRCPDQDSRAQAAARARSSVSRHSPSDLRITNSE
jgi:MOSC domain-containing protein YiiM